MIRGLAEAGYHIYATPGTAKMVRELGIDVEEVPKILGDEHPHVVDIINGGKVDAVVNTVTRDREVLQDGFNIRRAAVEQRIPCFTSLDTARAAVESLSADAASYSIRPLPAYRAGRGGSA